MNHQSVLKNHASHRTWRYVLFIIAATLGLGASGFAQQATDGAQPASSSQTSASQAQPDPSSIISAMLLRYYNASSLKATIVHTVAAMGKSQSIQTDLQFERPSLISIKQSRSEPDPQTWIASSDGKLFSYPVPTGVVLGSDQSKWLVEPVKNNLGNEQSIQDLLQAAADSLPDISDPVLIMAGWKDAQKAMIRKWSNLQLQTVVDKNGVKDWAITGIYTSGATGSLKGNFTMIISPDNDLLSMEIKRNFAIPNGTPDQAVQTVDTWICQTVLNGAVDHSLFKISK